MAITYNDLLADLMSQVGSTRRELVRMGVYGPEYFDQGTLQWTPVRGTGSRSAPVSPTLGLGVTSKSPSMGFDAPPAVAAPLFTPKDDSLNGPEGYVEINDNPPRPTPVIQVGPPAPSPVIRSPSPPTPPAALQTTTPIARGDGGGINRPVSGRPTDRASYAAWYNTLPLSARAYARDPGSLTDADFSPNEQDGFGPSPPSVIGGGNPLARNGLGFADGGEILGPGGPRDDNLLAPVSNGEVIVPADVVRAKGTEFFEKLKENVRTKEAERTAVQQATAAPTLGFADGGFIDYGETPLPMSASPGLDVLPAERQLNAGPSSLGLAAPEPVAAPPQAPAATVASGTSGLGLAEFKKLRSDDDKTYLQSLPTAQKIGLMLQSFAAGIEGRPSPIDQMLVIKQQREKEFRAELGTTLQTVKAGMEMVRRMPPGKARDALIDQISRALGSSGGIIRDALLSVGKPDEEELKNIVSVVSNPAAQAKLIKAVSGSQNPAQDVIKLMADKDFMDRLEKTADADVMPNLTGKMRVIGRAMERMEKFKDASGNVSFTMADLRDQNERLPREFQLTDLELGAAVRNQDALVAYGLKTDKALALEQEAAGKRKDTGTWSEPYLLNGAMVQKNSITGEIRTSVARAPQERPEPAPTVTEIIDPNDPTGKKTIKVNARTGEKIGDAPSKASGKAVPAPVQKQITEGAELVDATERFTTTFKSTYGGKTFTGELQNQWGKVFGDDTGQTQWWQDYELHQSQIRNKLFGAALTAPEIEAWNKSAINPRMNSGEIKKNLERRAKLEETGLTRLMRGAAANGYSKEAIEEFAGRPIPGSDPLVFEGYRFPNKEALERYKKAKGAK